MNSLLAQLSIEGLLQGIQKFISTLTANLPLIGTGIILILATILIVWFLKKFIVNTVLGLIAWGLAVFVFKISLPFYPSLAVSLLFGPAGIGVLLVLKAFGVI
ncbi:MAG: hypothetical protein HY393_02355 [Candidatus Diapherotrites archaeon]|nr:hypothetical protein [Candidatus Diapherotrites archaeon]